MKKLLLPVLMMLMAAGCIMVSPICVDFGRVVVGSRSAPRTVAVGNSDNATGDLVIGTIAIGGTNADQFSITSDNCTGRTLAPGDSAILEVVFSPTSVGAKTATLSIPSNDPDENPFDVPLSGTGTQPDITANPTSMDFGSVVAGASSLAHTVTVSDNGTADLVVGTVAITGANADQFSTQNDNCSGQTLAPGDSATLDVVFSPMSAGAKTATLSVPSNDPNEPTVDVALSGTGIQPSQQVATATGTGMATFATDSGDITGLTAVAEPTLTCPAMAELNFPHGFFSFNITNITLGSTVTITITLPSAIPAGTQYWKCQGGTWLDVTSLLGDDDGDNVLTLTLTDGGLGDADGVANGTIVEPGGPGIPTAAPTPTPTPAMPEGASVGGPAPVRLTSPDLSLKYLSVNPQQAYAGQPVTILTNVVNRGGTAGTYTVSLRINGRVEQSKTVSVGPYVAHPVKFRVTRSQPGAYAVEVGGQKGGFSVVGADGRRGARDGLMIAVSTLVLVVFSGLLVILMRRRLQGG